MNMKFKNYQYDNQINDYRINSNVSIIKYLRFILSEDEYEYEYDVEVMGTMKSCKSKLNDFLIGDD